MAIAWGKRAALGLAAVLLLGGAFGAGFFKGHSLGFATAENAGRASLAEYRETVAAARNQALQQANERLREQSARALKAGADYAKEKERHEKTRKTLEKRIASLAGGGDRHVDSDIVRLLNEAVGAVCPDGAGKNGGPGGAYGAPRPGASACAGIQTGNVTTRDLATFFVYYGNRSRTMESQLNALITRIEEYNR